MTKIAVTRSGLSLLGLGILLTGMSPCAGYSQNIGSDPLRFQLLTSVPNAPKPLAGDVVELAMMYKNSRDSVLFDNRKGEYNFTYVMTKPVYRYDFNVALGKLGVGDSASFVMNADSFYLKTIAMDKLPPYVKKGSNLTFFVKMKSMTPHQEYLKKQFTENQEYLNKMEGLRKLEKDSLSIFLDVKKIKVQPTSTGLYFIPDGEGNGPSPTSGKTAVIHYQASFLNGKTFDDTHVQDMPLEIVIGKHMTLKGLEEGVCLMKKGGKARLIIPSYLGFGENAAGSVPPFTTLVYDVELIDVK